MPIHVLQCLFVFVVFNALSSSQMMQSMREGAELVFLYQLTKGSCDSSFACHIASMCGLPASLVERAANVS